MATDANEKLLYDETNRLVNKLVDLKIAADDVILAHQEWQDETEPQHKEAALSWLSLKIDVLERTVDNAF